MEFIKNPVIMLTKEEKRVLEDLATIVVEYCETKSTCDTCPFSYNSVCGKSIFYSGLIKTSNYQT